MAEIIPPKMTILIVEDDKLDVINIKKEFLNFSSNFTFYVAENGEEAINALYGLTGVKKLDSTPDLIIVDIYMARMDGLTFVRKLRKDPQWDNIPIFILTQLFKTEDKIALQDLRVMHLIKPLSADDVLHMYMSALKTPGYSI